MGRVGMSGWVRVLVGRRWVGGAVAAFCLALLPFSAGSWAMGDPTRGRDLAATWCSSCHQIGPAFPPRENALSLMDIAGNPQYTDQYLRDWVAHTPATMPRFNLPPASVEDLISYIRSLDDGAAAGRGRAVLLARRANGSGFFISAAGHVMTVAHLAGQCARVTVEAPGVPRREARPVAVDVVRDLALLRVEGHVPSFAGFSPDVQLQVGERVAVYGFPLSGTLARGGTLSVGYVAALMGVADNVGRFQMSAELQPGASGSPVLDSDGAVVGVAVSRLTMMTSTAEAIRGVNFAVGGYAVQRFLAENGVAGDFRRQRDALPPERLAAIAKGFAVRVSCWR